MSTRTETLVPFPKKDDLEVPELQQAITDSDVIDAIYGELTGFHRLLCQANEETVAAFLWPTIEKTYGLKNVLAERARAGYGGAA